MVIKIPKKHCFPDDLKGEVMEITGHSLPNWEISVERKDALAWSIVLSFLISTNNREPEDFSRRLIALTGSDKNLNLVKNAIKTFNPFRDKYSCFNNKVLQTVVEDFKEKNNWNTTFRRRFPKRLFEVSKTLGCTVLHISIKQDITYKVYCTTRDNNINLIVLISSDLMSEDNIFIRYEHNFLLDHKLAMKRKLSSLRYILKEAGIPRKTSKKVERVIDEDHFLISLLHSDYQEVISNLYNSASLVSKLAEAGFETDPQTVDSLGFSAFHHALVLGKIEILYKLYYFSANSRRQTERPEGSLVNNLRQLKEIFSNDMAKFDTSFVRHPRYHEIKKDYYQLLRFNDFLLEIYSKLLIINSRVNYYNSTEEIFEAHKRQDIVLCVLDAYIFFQFASQDRVMQSQYDEFRNYYDPIDIATVVLFFSNVTCLKQRLALEGDNLFSQMEISFYLTVYYYSLLYSTHQEPFKPYFPKTSLFCNNIHHFIQFIRRSENLTNITKFCKYIRDTIITRVNVINYIPKEEGVDIFTSLPVYKNVLHLNRLKNYLQTAMKIKVVDKKSVLVIERVLQVLGEYVSPNNDNDFRRFLELVLPENVSHVLLIISKKLSNLKEKAVEHSCRLRKQTSRKSRREILHNLV